MWIDVSLQNGNEATMGTEEHQKVYLHTKQGVIIPIKKGAVSNENIIVWLLLKKKIEGLPLWAHAPTQHIAEDGAAPLCLSPSFASPARLW